MDTMERIVRMDRMDRMNTMDRMDRTFILDISPLLPSFGVVIKLK